MRLIHIRKSLSRCVSVCLAVGLMLTTCVMLTSCSGVGSNYPAGTIGRFVNDFNAAASKYDVAKLDIKQLDSHAIKSDGYNVIFNTSDDEDCTPETAIKVVGLGIDKEALHSDEYMLNTTVSFFYGVDKKFAEGETKDSISMLIASEPQDLLLINGYIIKKVESSYATNYVLIKATEEEAQYFK